MKTKRRTAVLATAVTLSFVAGMARFTSHPVVQAADKDDTRPRFVTARRDTLRGLDGADLVIEDVRPEMERYGLTRQSLRVDTELHLRQYGIKILSQDQFRAGTYTFLCVNVTVALDEEDSLGAAVGIRVSLYQPVSLTRDPMVSCGASTWETGRVLWVGRNRFEKIRSVVQDQVAKFIDDYLAVNPKRDKTQP